jgi:hypothetical protein
MNHADRIKWVLCISALFMMLNACATAAQSGQMVARPVDVPRINQNSPLYQSIAIVKVGGGQETNPLLTSRVYNKELEDALRESMKQYGFLSTSGVDAPYRLEVFLIDLKQPVSGGLTMIVDSFIRYKLISKSDEKIVYDDIITASYRATMDDALYGVKRLQIANEKSIQANITAFMQRLSALKVTQTTP